MIDAKYRRLMLLTPSIVLDAVIKGQQQEIALFVHRASQRVTSTDVSDRFAISVSHASTILNALVKKGYVYRAKRTHESGGVEFQYYPAFELGGE